MAPAGSKAREAIGGGQGIQPATADPGTPGEFLDRGKGRPVARLAYLEKGFRGLPRQSHHHAQPNRNASASLLIPIQVPACNPRRSR